MTVQISFESIESVTQEQFDAWVSRPYGLPDEAGEGEVLTSTAVPDLTLSFDELLP